MKTNLPAPVAKSAGAGARTTTALLAGFLVLVSPSVSQAQNKPFDQPADVMSNTQREGVGFRSGSFIVAPVPFDNPSLGTGLALGGAYLFKNDRLSDASTLAFGGFRSSNGSEGYGFGLNLSWDDDRWLAKLVVADADLNFDLYPFGTPVPVSQTISGVSLELAYSPVKNYRFGGTVAYGEYRLNPRAGAILSSVSTADASLDIARVSGFGEYDTRDDTIYPTTGSKITGTITRGMFIDLGRDAYTKAIVSGTRYWSWGSASVVAARAVACQTSDGAPFFDSCSLGTTDNFRGYVSTEFLDDALISFQAEYRGRLTGRIGLVGFAGAGSVGEDLGDAAGADFRAAAGVGLRIRLSKTFPLDYAIDLATNERGEQLLYISVGQRF